MVRVEIDSRPHMFKDGTFSSRDHIHIYNAETERNDTYNLDEFKTEFKNITCFNEVLNDFCSYMNFDIGNIQGVI
ncbi:hypothetical protein [uncultured Clostridium sp.]